MRQSWWRYKSCGLLCLNEWKIVTDFSKDHNIPVSHGVVALLGLFDPDDEETVIFWNVGNNLSVNTAEWIARLESSVYVLATL